MRRLAPEEEEEGALPDALPLSMPELQCAAGHALGVYGDLDEFVGEACALLVTLWVWMGGRMSLWVTG